MSLLSRFVSVFRPERLNRDIEEEQEFHIASRTEEFVDAGMEPDAAARRARLEFGNRARSQAESHDAKLLVWLESTGQDIHRGLRALMKSPSFAAVAVITLALGIGANTAIFSVLQAVMLAPLPYGQPDRLVLVCQTNPHASSPRVFLSYPDFQDWQRNARAFQQMAAFTWQEYDLTSPGSPAHLNGKQVSSDFFSILGVKLSLGHDFSPRQDHEGGAPVVVISNHLWRDRFASSTAALGRVLTLDGVDYTIIGVLPPGFDIEGPGDVYTLLGQGDPLIVRDRTIHATLSISRLKPGTSIAEAQADMSAVQENLDDLYPKADRGLGADVRTLKQEIVGDVGGTLWMLLGAVGVVLLIACANVASLLLARSAGRTREFAIRSALGASRARIVRQLLTESLLLSLAGAGLGLAVAKWGVSPLLAAVPGSLPLAGNVHLNAPVLLFTFGISIAVGILFGLAPALKSWNANPQASLKEGGRGATSAHHRAQSSLVIMQMALTLVLLVGAGLLFRTIRHLWDVNPGFDTQHIATFKVGLSPSVTKTPSRMRIAYEQLVERIREIPGVKAADLTTLVPLGGHSDDVPFWVGSQQPRSLAEAPRAQAYSTGPDYLRVMGIPLIRGRFFTLEDTVKSTPVVVIDNVLAHSYFPDSDPVGKTITFAHVGAYRIIGVVGHVRHSGLGDLISNKQVQTYTPFYQISDRWITVMHTSTTVVVRTPLGTTALMPAIRAAVYEGGSDQPIYEIQTMQQIVSESMAPQRLPMVLLGAFSGLALLLASVGIYGLTAYSVEQRTQEIGIRLALGAQKRDVFWMVIGQGLRLALVGIAIGVAAALVLTRLLSSLSHLLFGVGTGDPATFAAISLLLAVVAVLVCYIPARRAAKVDPIVALRYE